MQPDFRAALAQFVREHMPWPFYDIGPNGTEGVDTAWAIATSLERHFEREFAAIAHTAKEAKRRTYPAHAQKDQGHD